MNTLDGASYTYDATGNRTAKTNYLNGVTSNYGYDPLYELTQVTQGGSTTESYSYDPVGNRLSSLGVPNYNYNVSNELTSSSSGSYTYDANGNTLSDAQGRSFSWDFENRLTQAVVPGTNGGMTTFKYDPFGRRIYKQSPNATSIFLYNGVNLVETVNGSGSEVASYARTRSVDETLAEQRGGTANYYEPDALGSITSLSGAAGALANTYIYDSFGNLDASTSTLSNYLQYTGREYDTETGLYYYRARYYDPKGGRFLGEDPLRFRATVNSYAYALNDPLRWSDPDGRKISFGLIYDWYENARNATDLLLCAAQTYYCLHNLASTVSSVGGQDPTSASGGADYIRATCKSDENCRQLFCSCVATYFTAAMGPLSPPSWVTDAFGPDPCAQNGTSPPPPPQPPVPPCYAGECINQPNGGLPPGGYNTSH